MKTSQFLNDGVKNVLRMSESQIREHWGAKMNEGYEEWPRKTSARAMVSFVSRGGRIGYVNAEELSSLPKSEKVKIVLSSVEHKYQKRFLKVGRYRRYRWYLRSTGDIIPIFIEWRKKQTSLEIF